MDHLTPPEGLNFNTRLQMDGVELLRGMDSACAAAVFLDPQYDPAPRVRLMVGKLWAFTRESRRVLRAGGYLFLWIKKRHIVSREWYSWLPGDLSAVDLIAWDTGRDAHSTTGEPSWTTPQAAYLIVAQRPPRSPSSGWERQAIPDVWHEEPIEHPSFSPTPPGLLARLIEASTTEGDLVIDPAAGTFSVLDACQRMGRVFFGCDLNG